MRVEGGGRRVEGGKVRVLGGYVKENDVLLLK